MISILAVDPSFGGTYNVKRALGELDDVVLLCTHLDKWRRWPAGTIDLVVQDQPKRAAAFVKQSHFVFLVGGSSVTVVQELHDFENVIRNANLVAWFTDTYHRLYGDQVLETLAEWGCSRYFWLPDDVYTQFIPEGAIPLYHPISLPGDEKRRKRERLTIIHSPGTVTKRQQKRSDEIEKILGKLQTEFGFDYECLMHLPNEVCLQRKYQAHVFIDKLPSPASAGLGKSGLEGMAGGCVVLSAIYSGPRTERYLPRPAVLAVSDVDLEDTLRELLTVDRSAVSACGALARNWVETYCGLENGSWMKYFKRYAKL